jgi:hypothetical protein
MKSPGSPQAMSGKDEIAVMIEEVFTRDMTHEVREVVVGEDRISYMVLCEYPDGKRVVGSYVCDLDDAGRITRIVEHVSWDE